MNLLSRFPLSLTVSRLAQVTTRPVWLLAALLGLSGSQAVAWTLPQPEAAKPPACVSGADDETAWRDLRTVENFGISNLCIRELSEGMAAVLLPAADPDHPSREASNGQSELRWGFLNQDGQLTVAPIFEEVGQFNTGLAPARENGLWGYINRSGHWAIAPHWQSAGRFSSVGLAIVVEDGQQVLINRAGTRLPTPWGRNVAQVILDDGDVARAILSYRNEYVSGSGVRRYVSGNQRLLQQLGDGPFYVATLNGEKVGLLDENWRWKVRPRYEAIGEAMPNGMGTIQEGNVLRFIDSRTGEIGSSRFNELAAMTDQFWVGSPVDREDGSYQIFSAQGVLLNDHVPVGGLAQMRQIGSMLLYRTDDQQYLYVPGKDEAIVLPATWQNYGGYDDYLLFYRGEQDLAGVVTPTGDLLSIEPGSALETARDLRSIAGRLWMMNDNRQILNILDTNGKLLLAPSVVQQLDGVPLRLLDLEFADAPLAILAASHCDCDDGGVGLLLADGSLKRRADWKEVQLLIGGEDQAKLERLADLRFAATTEDGVVLLDGKGDRLDVPTQQHIADFRYGYALVFSKGVARLLNQDGSLLDLPDFFDFKVVGPELISYVEDAADGSLWGLYDITQQRVVAPPSYRRIEDFHNGYAIAANDQGKLGVIGTDGRWTVAAAYDEMRAIGDKHWLVRKRVADQSSYEWPSAMVNAQGKVLTPFVRGMHADTTAQGMIQASNSLQAWVIGPDDVALPMGNGYRNQIGDWLEIRREVEYGLLDHMASWVVKPDTMYLSRMQNQRVLRSNYADNELLDAKGKRVADLGEGQWEWNPASRYPARVGQDDEGERSTDFAGPDGRIIAKARGHVLAFDGQTMLERSTQGMLRWLDKQGQPKSEFRTWLSLPQDGVAGAATVDGTYPGLGYINTQSELVIPPVYLAISPFQQGRAVASTNDASYLLDTTGKPLAWVTLECQSRVLRNARGERVWPTSTPQCW